MDIPENLKDLPFQVITIDHPKTAAVFTLDEQGNPEGVYYNLGALVHMLNQQVIIPRSIIAVANNNDSDTLRIEGAYYILENIRVSGLELMDEFQAFLDQRNNLPSVTELNDLLED
jgi:hypothetical protein